jgi:hypothetical protein
MTSRRRRNGYGTGGVSGPSDRPRSTQRRQPYVPDDEPRLVRDMVRLATQYGRCGYRRVTELLRREGWKVNHKRLEAGGIGSTSETAEATASVAE